MKTEPWRRLLWLKQEGYPDNYTDPNFLKKVDELAERGLKKDYDLLQIHRDFLDFYNIIINSSLIYIIFNAIYKYNVNVIPLTSMTSTLCIIIGYNKITQRIVNYKSILIILFTMLTLSPVIKSLSWTMATNSIWVISMWLTIYYVYQVFLTITKHKPNKNLMTNILIANFVLLSSRFETIYQVYCFILNCIELIIILPQSLNLLQDYRYVTVMNLVFYGFLMWDYGMNTMIIVFIINFSVFALLPTWYYYNWQLAYKRNDHDLVDEWETKKVILDM